ncbi:MAG TPA: transporter substrate-binding domain-containing protein [Campylobacterales bacterium]|nr:transporter substrate-binding domain-containing protein [Campylobacterales bacterium]
MRSDNLEIKSLKDLKNKTIYLKEKIIAHDLTKEFSKSIKIIDVKTDEEIYQKLSKNSDVVATVSYSIDREKLKSYHLKIAHSGYDKYGNIHIGISHKHPQLHSIIDKIYKIIPTNELTVLQQKNISKAKIISLL